MRPADAHLTPQEFELLLFEVADSNNSNATGASVPEAQQHLSGCVVCQSVAERYHNAEKALKDLDSRNKASVNKNRGDEPLRGPDCPVDATWLSLAAGLLEEDEASRYVTHAATCDWCGPRLKESMEDLAQDVNPEEQEALAELPTASLAWQREMGRKLAARVRNSETADWVEKATHVAGKEMAGKEETPSTHKVKEKTGIFWLPRLRWVGAACAVLVAAVWFMRLKINDADVNQLLAQAYAEQRTIELRMPGAQHAPTRIERGRRRSHLNRPMSLLDAESIIRHGLDKHPEDPAWLDKRGRAELLEGDYESAIATLRRANDLQNAAPAIPTDLATAYFERAEAEGHTTDYGTAAELLSSVLQRNPEDDVALFNRAIVYERLFRYREAIKDWERYLHLSRDEGWNGEARQHLEQLNEKVK